MVSALMPHAYRAARSIPLNTYRASHTVWGFVHVVDWNMRAANAAHSWQQQPCGQSIGRLYGRPSIVQVYNSKQQRSLSRVPAERSFRKV